MLESTEVTQVRSFLKSLKPKWSQENLIRIGGSLDGGYLVPTDIDTYDLLVSPGVGESYEFDRYFINRRVDSVLIDPDVVLPSADHLFHIKKLLGSNTNSNEDNISHEKILSDYGVNKSKILLQMDIEGSEYEVLSSINNSNINRFAAIIVEFHHLSGLSYRGMFPLIEQVFNKILNNHFVAHIHVNNSGRVLPFKGIQIPDTIEFTFLSKDFYEQSDNVIFSSPHPLDVKCLDSLPEIPVPKGWWSA